MPAVKDRESGLHVNLQRDFVYLDRTGAVAHDRCETVERGHGRIERSTCTIMGGPNGIPGTLLDRCWVVQGCAVRVENGLHWGTGRHTREDRCRLRTGHAARNMVAL